jgi:hypothetical protein
LKLEKEPNQNVTNQKHSNKNEGLISRLYMAKEIISEPGRHTSKNFQNFQNEKLRKKY